MLLPHATKAPNLWLPGLTAEGRPRTTAHIPGLFDKMSLQHQQGGQGDLYLPEVMALKPGLAGVVVVDLIRGADAYVEQRFIGDNIITDLGALAMLKALDNIGALASGFVFIDQSHAAATIASTFASGSAYTTVTVAGTSGGTSAGGNPTFQTANAGSTFQSNASNNGTKQNNNSPTPNVGAGGTVVPGSGLDSLYGTGISLSFGMSTEEGVAGSTTANSATNINITSFTTFKNHNIGEWVVAHPSATDNPTTLPTGGIFSTAQTQAPTGSGIANRTNTFTFAWAPGVLTAGVFTALSLCNTNAWAAGILYARAPITPVNVSLTAGVTATYIVKI